jgi:ketosteroid isomerase-like protein
LKKISPALATATLATGVAGAATDKTDVIATVHQYTDDFNKGGTQSSLALCADQAIIIDDFPPYQWSGSGACAKWLNDFHAFTKQIQLTDLVATLGEVRHVYVTADRAYVVVPATVTCKEQGKPVHETGATWTFTLQKGSSGWRIAGWAFAAGIGAVKTDAGN